MSYLQKLKNYLSPVLLAIFLFVTIFAPIAQAQDTGPWYNQSFEQWSRKVFEDSDEEIFGERYTFAQVQWIFYSLAAILTGGDILECATGGDVETYADCVRKMGPVDNGDTGQTRSSGVVLGLAAFTDTLMSTKPASGVEYIADSAAKFNVISEAKAQGTGFESLQPIQHIWRAFRNMSYFFMIIVVLIMAFMIMFRVKLNPQTVISVQSALPRIVTALLLITFSYAIAGLVIDFSYLVIALLAAFAKAGGLVASSVSTLEVASAMWGGSTGFFGVITPLILGILVVLVLVSFGLGATVGATTSAALFGVGGIPLGIVTGLIVFFLGLLFVVITIIRIWWMLLKAFLNIVMLVIFGPLLLMLGAVSPSVGGVGVWLKNLLSNVAVFVTVSVMGFLAHLLYWASDQRILRDWKFLNPFGVEPSIIQGGINLPHWSLSPATATFLLAIGILLIMPSAGELIKAVIAGQPFAFGNAIGASFAPMQTLWGLSGGRDIWSAYRQGASEIRLGKIKDAVEAKTFKKPTTPGWMGKLIDNFPRSSRGKT